MNNCSCEMIPVYVMAVLIGVLIGVMTTNNPITDSMGYWVGQLAYYEMDLINHPMAFYTNPFFLVVTGLVCMWKRNTILNIPWSIYYHLEGIISKPKQPSLRRVNHNVKT